MQTSQSLIILLLIANLVATVWFGLHKEPRSVPTQAEKSAKHELPSVVNSEVKDQIFSEFVKAFNAADYDALYDMFGPAAKAQFSKESAETEFRKFDRFFHSVESGAFTHSEFERTQGNTNIYVLYYAVRLPKSSELSASGTLKITVAVQGSEYQIYGIRLKAG